MRRELPERILVDDRVAADNYAHWLSRTGIVVSTRRHEFQGLSVMEAAIAGAMPLVPDALCYPEQYPPCYRYRAQDPVALVERLQSWPKGARPPPVGVSVWYGEELWKRWRSLLTMGRVAA